MKKQKIYSEEAEPVDVSRHLSDDSYKTLLNELIYERSVETDLEKIKVLDEKIRAISQLSRFAR